MSKVLHGLQALAVVSPVLSYPMLVPGLGDGQRRTIAELQQKARMLEARLERQRELARQRERVFSAEKEALTLALDEAQQATRSRDELLAVVCHDLRNPLSAVLMTTDLLLRPDGDAALPSALHSHLERVERSAVRMKRFVDDLADFASIRSGVLRVELQPMAPAYVVECALETFQQVARHRKILLETTVEDGLPLVACDLGRAVQVMSNLLSNALGATASGGVVTAGAARRHGEVLFWVDDTGAGIAADELPHVFERSWRGRKPGYAGTGLGLFIAKGIVDTHGGRIWAASTVGVGSRFWFTLPSV